MVIYMLCALFSVVNVSFIISCSLPWPCGPHLVGHCGTTLGGRNTTCAKAVSSSRTLLGDPKFVRHDLATNAVNLGPI